MRIDRNFATSVIERIADDTSNQLRKEDIFFSINEVLKSVINTDGVKFDESQNAAIPPSNEPMVHFLHEVEGIIQSFKSRDKGIKLAKKYVRFLLQLAEEKHADSIVIEDLKEFLKMLNEKGNTKHNTTKIVKILLSIIIMGLFLVAAFFFFSCTGHTSDMKRDTSSSQQTTGDKSESTNFLDYVGQYEFTDIQGQTFVLTINDNATADLFNDDLHYGASCFDMLDKDFIWSYSLNKAIPITYHHIALVFANLPHKIIFPSGKKPVLTLSIPIGANYIYCSDNEEEIKNPQNRLKLRKIK